MKRLLVVVWTLGLFACDSPALPGPSPSRPAVPPEGKTSALDIRALGARIWRNECAGSVRGLVSWNAGEAFPSLGIGHFIWYPRGYRGPFDESFPKLIAYARQRGIGVPACMTGVAPWPNKAAFAADTSGKAEVMRQWLAGHLDLQTQFMIARSRAALPVMLEHSRSPRAVKARYEALASTTQGMYCLVDYVNFKGEGIQGSERYNGQGWGLLQVLETMRGNPQGAAATVEFSRAAALVMKRRVANAPAARHEEKWLPGWLNRCRTYAAAR